MSKPLDRAESGRRLLRAGSPEERLIESYRIPLIATLLCLLTLLSVYGLAREVLSGYAAVGAHFHF